MEIGCGQIYDGYLSDVYFVDLVTLESTVFGKYLKANGVRLTALKSLKTLATESPADCPELRPEVSDGTIVGSVPPTNNWAKAFDGNTVDTYVTPNSRFNLLASPIPFTKLEIKLAVETLKSTVLSHLLVGAYLIGL